jgi:hypothetical protein
MSERTWIPVVGSSNVEAYSYDLLKEILYVQYSGGKRYEYYKVPSAVFLDMVCAESKGKFLAANVKGKFEYGHYLAPEPTSDDETEHDG